MPKHRTKTVVAYPACRKAGLATQFEDFLVFVNHCCDEEKSLRCTHKEYTIIDFSSAYLPEGRSRLRIRGFSYLLLSLPQTHIGLY